MKKVSLAILVSLTALTGAAYAQDNGVTMSTDPAKAADVEQRAQALEAQQQSMQSNQAMPAKHNKGSTSHKKAAKPAAASQ
jgi:DNA-binding transcriptional regulator of glucitol operon